ncbi:hypothetical protein F4810DRAFT_719140 [Camillea tinctor]|nr:hypothetical protein F4810DRAFT_719140 [Camillea tinctor]
MSIIGKLQASLASAKQETTVAFANANFDFSLIRCEAPAEYRELGVALAENKRSEAESGRAHITAIRLGSLFKSILPETPNLIRAYGTRASEIAQSPIVNPRGTEAHGPFKDYVGVDGTSIWAAATSSSAAIAAHLLACMIACCWRHDEATAIWLEIVSERKRELEEKVTEEDYFVLSDAVASKLELDTDQLANWDTSARAWLAAASDAPIVKLRQAAVRSLLNKVNTPVNGWRDVYSSVMEAWKASLQTFEKLICGASYSIHDGAVILALMSWHLYPDIIVQGPAVQEIIQKDDLISPGGIITIGLRNHLPENSSETPGVHWSLSLGHLRYYGANKPTTRSLTNLPSGNARFTFEEFVLVFLGAIIGQWNQKERISLESALEFINVVITKFGEAISRVPDLKSRGHLLFIWSWVSVISSAIRSCRPEFPMQQEGARKLLLLGMRKFDFLTEPSSNNEMPAFRLFGLDTLKFVEVLENSEVQDEYVNNSFRRFMKSREKLQNGKQKFFIRMGKSENQIDTLILYSRHKIKKPENQENEITDVIRSIEPDGGYTIDLLPHSITKQVSSNPETLLWMTPPKQVRELFVSAAITTNQRGVGEGFLFMKVAETNKESIYGSVHFSNHCAVSERCRYFPSDIPQSYEEVLQHTQNKKLNPGGVLCIMDQLPLFNLLQVLAASSELYSELPGATITPEILESRSIWSISIRTSWTFPTSRNSTGFAEHAIARFNANRGDAFRMLSFFETGYDVGSTLGSSSKRRNDWLQSILAISTEDALYIASEILGDPAKGTKKISSIRRIRGNVGRPGLTFIGWFSDQVMECRQASPMRWQVVNHNPFDGKLEDYFGNTSIHLRPTGYVKELSFGANNRVSNGSIMDAALSAYDQGEWLGDFRIFNVWSTPECGIVVPVAGCTGEVVGSLPGIELVTIENWEEFLSPHPSLLAVFKSHGNWQARLTAVAMCIQLGYRPILFGDHGCWRCALKLLPDETADSEESEAASSSSDASEDESQDDEHEAFSESSSQLSKTRSQASEYKPTIFIL